MSDRQAEAVADARLAERLLRGGVAPRHVRRSLRELGDHRIDLIAQLQEGGLPPAEAAREAQLRLGDRDMLAEQMLARPELRSRARRFAWLLFGVAPLFATTILGLVVFFAVLAIGGYDLDSGGHEPAQAGVLKVAGALLHWVVPASIGLLLCAIALSRRMPPLWPILGLVLTALISSGTRMDPDLIAIGAPLLSSGRGLVLSSALVIIYLLANHVVDRERHP